MGVRPEDMRIYLCICDRIYKYQHVFFSVNIYYPRIWNIIDNKDSDILLEKGPIREKYHDPRELGHLE
jgi:hypothetical protein